MAIRSQDTLSAATAWESAGSGHWESAAPGANAGWARLFCSTRLVGFTNAAQRASVSVWMRKTPQEQPACIKRQACTLLLNTSFMKRNCAQAGNLKRRTKRNNEIISTE